MSRPHSAVAFLRLPLLAAAAAATGACAADVSQSSQPPEKTGRAFEPIIGGTPTAVRPEIGEFQRPVVINGQHLTSHCTATLIAPSFALTAGHCIAPPDNQDDTRNVTVVPGDTFVLGSGMGLSPNGIPVTRIVSFGQNINDFVPGHGLYTDVLLLQLATPVPPAQAVPAQLARTYANPNDLVTELGFGCVDAHIEPCSGAGTKRFTTIRWENSDTNAVGDSGGPVILPGPNGIDGSVFATISGAARSWFSEWDVFGDAAWAATQIEPLVRAADPNGLESDTSRYGLVYTLNFSSSALACQASCASDAQCQTFTWLSGGGFGLPICFLQAGVPDRVPAPGVVSGFSPNRAEWVETNVDRPGSDYRNFDAPGWGTADITCSGQCAADPQCRAFTYVAATSTTSGHCWLKNGVPSPVQSSTQMWSAVKAGLEMDTDRPGWDYNNFDVSPPFPETCQSACWNDYQCWAWTFTRATPSANAHCWLKSGVPAPSPHTDAISGVWGSEFL